MRFRLLTQDEVKRYISLIVVDSLKINKIIKQRMSTDCPKDSVKWLAYVLANCPEIFKELPDLSTNSSIKILRSAFTHHIHMRQLYFGESVQASLITQIPENISVSVDFWLMNEFGFRKPQGGYNEQQGSRFDPKILAFYESFLTMAKQAESIHEINNQINTLHIERAQHLTGCQFSKTSLIIARCIHILYVHKIADEQELNMLRQTDIDFLTQHLPQDENNFDSVEISFFAGLPRRIREEHPTLSVKEILSIMVSVLQRVATIKGHATIPLFALINNKDIVKLLPHLVKLPPKSEDVFIKEDGQFVNLELTKTCVAALEACAKKAQQESETANDFLFFLTIIIISLPWGRLFVNNGSGYDQVYKTAQSTDKCQYPISDWLLSFNEISVNQNVESPISQGLCWRYGHCSNNLSDYRYFGRYGVKSIMPLPHHKLGRQWRTTARSGLNILRRLI